MAFWSPENVQRNEPVRFQLESNIRAPANAQEQQKKLLCSLILKAGYFSGSVQYWRSSVYWEQRKISDT